jgi:hypothetical protein
MTDLPSSQLSENVIEYVKDNIVLLSGTIGLIGCAVVAMSHVLAMLLHPSHNPMSDTISDLAAGRYGWIQDAGLIIYALSLIICAIGLKAWNPGGDGFGWNLGLALLIVVGLDVLVIAAYNEYGNRDPGGVVIHIYLVYILGFGFAATTWLIGRGLRNVREWMHKASIALAIIWLCFAPPFLMMPTEWDGGYERLLAGILIGWTAGISWLLLQQGRGAITT